MVAVTLGRPLGEDPKLLLDDVLSAMLDALLADCDATVDALADASVELEVLAVADADTVPVT